MAHKFIESFLKHNTDEDPVPIFYITSNQEETNLLATDIKHTMHHFKENTNRDLSKYLVRSVTLRVVPAIIQCCNRRLLLCTTNFD